MDIYSREPGRYRYRSYKCTMILLYRLEVAVLLSTYLAATYMAIMYISKSKIYIINHFISYGLIVDLSDYLILLLHTYVESV